MFVSNHAGVNPSCHLCYFCITQNNTHVQEIVSGHLLNGWKELINEGMQLFLIKGQLDAGVRYSKIKVAIDLSVLCQNGTGYHEKHSFLLPEFCRSTNNLHLNVKALEL